MTIGVAEEAAIASAGDNRACSDGECGKNECSSGEGIGSRIEWRGSAKKGPFCHGY